MQENNPIVEQATAQITIEINAAAKKALEATSAAAKAAIEVGRLLSEAKEEVPHGQWESWIKENLSFGPRQARRYLEIYRDRDAVMERVATDGVFILDPPKSSESDIRFETGESSETEEKPGNDVDNDDPGEGYEWSYVDENGDDLTDEQIEDGYTVDPPEEPPSSGKRQPREKTPAEQHEKARKTLEASMREIEDLNDVMPSKRNAKAMELIRELLEVVRQW